MKKYIYLIMGEQYIPIVARAEFISINIKHVFQTVKNFDAAIDYVTSLDQSEPIAIELCGAFGQARARELMRLTNYLIPISYAVHEPEMDDINYDYFHK